MQVRRNPQLFLRKAGKGKTTLLLLKKQTLFSQGEAAEAVFYIQSGKVKLTVVSQQGKEAVIAILEQGRFLENPAWDREAGQRPRRPSRIVALYASKKMP